MKKSLKNIIFSLLAFSVVFTGCSPKSNNSSNNYDDYDYVGGDETDSKRYVYADSGVLATTKIKISNITDLTVVTNPQRMPSETAFDTATTIFKVDIDTYHKTSSYRNGIECILYTPDFYFANTNATNEYYEMIATYDNTSKKYMVTQINENGKAYIPLNGIVIAVPKQNPAKGITMSNPINVGSTIEFTTGYVPARYDYAIVNQDGIRAPFNTVNEYRSDSNVVLYSKEYGSYTKTNEYGAEIYVDYDFKKDQYFIAGFRGNGKVLGDLNEDPLHYGGKIPNYGFAISAHRKAYGFQWYREGRKFLKGDTITLENYYLYSLNKSTQFIRNGVDNSTVRNNDKLNVVTPEAPFLDEFGYTNYGLWQAYELAVVNMGEYGLVTAMDREVGCPKDGYILSGQGQVATKLQECARLGSLVKLDGNKIYIIDDVGTNQVVELLYYENLLDTKLLEGKTNLYDYDYETLETNINQLKKYNEEISALKQKMKNETSDKKIESYAVEIMYKMTLAKDCYNIAYAAANESPYVDGRAAWLFSTNTNSLKEVQDMIKHYKEANINLIYLCFFDGTTSFETETVPLNQGYVGDFGEYGQNNFLGAFIGEAHKAGIQVHGWTTNFHVGNVGDSNVLFNNHPDWQQVYYDGNVDSKDEMTEQTLLYFDQTNPEVQDFLIDFYNEVLEKFDLDGLHLDYIRYAAGNDVASPNNVYCQIPTDRRLYAENCLNRTQGYTEHAMTEFKEKYNLDPSVDVKEYVKDINNYLKWSEYRTSVITDFVKRIHDEVIVPNDTMLSMAIVPEVEHAKANKMQDWTTWVNNGWIDMVNGMYYSSDPNRILIESNQVKDIEENKVYDYPGILVTSYYSLPNIQNIYYIQAAHKAFNMGVSIFDANAIYSYQRLIYSNSNIDLETLLKIGTHRNKAVLPNDSLDKVVEAFISNISDRIDNIYLKNNAMTETQKTQLMEKLNQLSKTDSSVLINQLTTLKASLSQYGNDKIVDRIGEYIDVMLSISNIKIARNR